MKIIFKDFCEKYFEENYLEMINWLNLNLVRFKVDFISPTGEILKNSSWYVNLYEPSKGNWPVGSLRVEMTNGQAGTASGLIFFDIIPQPNENKSKIRWYKNGKLYDDK